MNLDFLVDVIKTRRIYSPRQLATDTFEAFCYLIKQHRSSHKELANLLVSYTEEISECCRPHATVAENVALRILKIATSLVPCALHQDHQEEGKSLQYLLESKPTTCDCSQSELMNQCVNENNSSFPSTFEEDLEAFHNELDTCMDDISSQAIQHIHSNETIMVYGHSGTVENFLKNAGKRRKFRVIVCQAYPDQVGHTMVKALSSVPNIEVTLIPDSCVFAMMARVNKVILSCYYISADGGLCARSGCNTMALSAANFGIPILVCTGLYKLSPRYQYSSTVCGRDIDYSFPVSPQPILDFYNASALGGVEVLNPSFDYISANLITLFITNRGALSPSYMYRLLKELYPLHDVDS